MLQLRAVSWYHQYLQHPRHTHLEEALQHGTMTHNNYKEPTSACFPGAIASGIQHNALLCCTNHGHHRSPRDKHAFLIDTARIIRSTRRTILQASPWAAIFGWDMMFGVPFLADWIEIGEHRQYRTNLTTAYALLMECLGQPFSGSCTFKERWYPLQIRKLEWK